MFAPKCRPGTPTDPQRRPSLRPRHPHRPHCALATYPQVKPITLPAAGTVPMRAQSAREFVTEFSGGATPHRSGMAQS